MTPDNDNQQDTQTPAVQPATSETPALWRRMLRIPLRVAHVVDRFLHEVNHDHKFWVNALGMKGGAGAAMLATTLGLSYALTFPFMMATAMIAGCAVLAGLGTLAAVTGFGTFWQKARAAACKARGLPPPPPKPENHRNWLQKLGDSPLVKKIGHSKPIQFIAHSKPWALTKKIVRHQQHNVLSGFAVGGAVLSTSLGVWVLAAQVVVLPVVAVGSMLTLASVWAVTTIASGVAGTFFSIKNVAKMSREKKTESRAAKMAAVEQQPAATVATAKKAHDDFAAAARQTQAPANDNPAGETSAKAGVNKPTGPQKKKP